MKITFDWLKDHLKTNLKEKNLLEQLTNIGPVSYTHLRAHETG